MADLELTRLRDDRRLYVLAGVGTLRLEGLVSRRAAAEAGGDSWRFARRGFWQRVIQATDTVGTVVGQFEPLALRRGGLLGWGDREFTLRPASNWRERYALVDGDHELATVEGRGWGRRPVKLTLGDAAAVEPGLLLFTAFIVRGLADDASGAAGGGASAAVGS